MTFKGARDSIPDTNISLDTPRLSTMDDYAASAMFLCWQHGGGGIWACFVGIEWWLLTGVFVLSLFRSGVRYFRLVISSHVALISLQGAVEASRQAKFLLAVTSGGQHCGVDSWKLTLLDLYHIVLLLARLERMLERHQCAFLILRFCHGCPPRFVFWVSQVQRWWWASGDRVQRRLDMVQNDRNLWRFDTIYHYLPLPNDNKTTPS